jgi:hypothetical protein
MGDVIDQAILHFENVIAWTSARSGYCFEARAQRKPIVADR